MGPITFSNIGRECIWWLHSIANKMMYTLCIYACQYIWIIGKKMKLNVTSEVVKMIQKDVFKHLDRCLLDEAEDSDRCYKNWLGQVCSVVCVTNYFTEFEILWKFKISIMLLILWDIIQSSSRKIMVGHGCFTFILVKLRREKCVLHLTPLFVCNLNISTKTARFMGPTWGPPGSCRPQIGPILAPWTLLSGYIYW